eukprot:gene38629-46960_t
MISLEGADGFAESSKIRPTIAGTWDFSQVGIAKAIPLLKTRRCALDVVEEAVRAVELDTQDQYYVGVGGYPNAAGVMELDAAIMDHQNNYGAVMSLPRIANPISVARSVMEQCPHNILTGQGALQWAIAHNFIEEDILTEAARKEWEDWVKTQEMKKGEEAHDTVGIVCIDADGRLAAGTSTSGWKFKHPGRVGDSPLIGSGLYCDGKVGAAVVTGDGEEIMRTCTSFLVVELMRMGVEVGEACSRAVQRVASLPRPPSPFPSMHSSLVVGVVAIDKHGKVGGASTLVEGHLHRGRPFFPVSVWRPAEGEDLAQAREEMFVLKASVEGVSG